MFFLKIAQKQLENLGDRLSITGESCESQTTETCPNLLYQLLTSKNTDSVQKSSALWNNVSNNLDMDIKSSQSLTGRRHTHPKRTQSASGPVRELSRPASASRMHPYQQTVATSGGIRKGPKSSGSSPSPSVSIDSGVIEEPLDLTREVFHASSYPTSDLPSEQHNLLKNILCGGGGLSTSGSSNLSSPPAWSQSPPPTTPVPNPTSYVHLAKKNLYPVQSRINEWMKSIAALMHKSTSDIQRDSNFYALTWPRLMALLMAENNFVFVTSPVMSNDETQDSNINEETFATAEQVEEFRSLLRECASLMLDSYTFELLQHIVIHKENRADKLIYPTLVQCLQKHLHAMTGNDQLYSQLSVLLSKLFALAEIIIEKLFCKHVDRPVESYLRLPISM